MLTPSSVSVGMSALRITWTSTRSSPSPFARSVATKSALEDLDASRPAASGPGSARSRTTAVKAGQDQAFEMRPERARPEPPTGSSPRRSEKISIRTIPNQNAGMPSPTTESAADRRGRRAGPCATAATDASGTVIRTANSVAMATSAAVWPIRGADQRDGRAPDRRRSVPRSPRDEVADEARRTGCRASASSPH